MLDDVALAAQLHHAQRRGRPRCFCKACVTSRSTARRAALASYMRVLLAEAPQDLEEIARVKGEMPPPPVSSSQPWQPRPPRNTAVAGESAQERPAA